MFQFDYFGQTFSFQRLPLFQRLFITLTSKSSSEKSSTATSKVSMIGSTIHTRKILTQVVAVNLFINTLPFTENKRSFGNRNIPSYTRRQGVVSLDPRSWWSKDSKGFGWEETTPSSRMRHQEEDQFRDFFSRCCHFSLAAWFCTPPIWRRELADNGWRCTFWHAPSSAGFLNLYNKMVVILNYKLTNKKYYFATSGTV